jgi:SAM-dependent methyltransferase
MGTVSNRPIGNLGMRIRHLVTYGCRSVEQLSLARRRGTRGALGGRPMPAEGGPASMEPPESIAARLRAGRGASDEEFDQVYSLHQRWISRRQWTPVAVARRAAQLLTEGNRRLVLDIGSGVGKFCIVGALTAEALFMGVEQRPHLVASARAAASRFGTERAIFFEGDFTVIDFAIFESFYLFNPFEEQLRAGVIPIDDTLDLSPRWFRRHVLCLFRKLRETRRGTRVLTYYGHGGLMPPGYRMVLSEAAGSDALVLWEKQ